MIKETPHVKCTRCTRPVMRYHGGKWMLALWIISHFPAHRIYTEVFGGAASVLIRKPRVYSEVYNDLNGEVTNLFRILQDPASAKDLRNLLYLTPYARDEFKLSYQPSPDPLEAARRLLIRSFMGFGSAAASNSDHMTGFRSNANRSGTTPAHDWMHLPDALGPVTERLRGVVIENRPALEVLKQHDEPGVLHYVDPPYPHETRCYRELSSHNGYKCEMTNADHEKLLECLMGLQGMVVLSSYPNEMYEGVLGAAGWMEEKRAARADGARARTEVLWKNPAALAAAQGSLFL